VLPLDHDKPGSDMSAAAFLGRYETGHQPGCRVVHTAARANGQPPFDYVVQPEIAGQPKGPRDSLPSDGQAARDSRTGPALNPPAIGLSREFRCPIL
jgi:hypothetical protein